jgi:hypothetical protein
MTTHSRFAKARLIVWITLAVLTAFSLIARSGAVDWDVAFWVQMVVLIFIAILLWASQPTANDDDEGDE